MEYDVKLERSDIQVLLLALGEVPIKHGVNTLLKIQNAVKAQDDEHAAAQVAEQSNEGGAA